MATLAAEVLDTNSLGALSTALALTTETLVTIYVWNATGTSKRHKVQLQVSPDGTNWLDTPDFLVGIGCNTLRVNATKVRLKVTGPEVAVSTCNVMIIAS